MARDFPLDKQASAVLITSNELLHIQFDATMAVLEIEHHSGLVTFGIEGHDRARRIKEIHSRIENFSTDLSMWEVHPF